MNWTRGDISFLEILIDQRMSLLDMSRLLGRSWRDVRRQVRARGYWVPLITAKRGASDMVYPYCGRGSTRNGAGG